MAAETVANLIKEQTTKLPGGKVNWFLFHLNQENIDFMGLGHASPNNPINSNFPKALCSTCSCLLL